jgi:predicted TIM-barrel fold metal-dependent hydrolase
MASYPPVNFPPDPNPKTPRLKAPPGSWDTHFHVWGPPHLFPYAETRNHTPPAAPIEHYLAVARVLGLQRGVMVQPNAHGTDTRITLDAIEKAGGRIRGMIRADPKLTPEEMKRLHERGVRGLRIALRHEDGHSFNPDLFLQMLKLMAPLQWPIDLQVDSDALEPLSGYLRASPVPVIIDTFGYIDLRKGGLEQPAFRTMVALLESGKVWVKLHGANRFMAWGIPYEDIVQMARAYIAAAPSQILWGTDWPHSAVYEPGKMPNDGDLLDMVLDYAPDPAVQKRILVDNPAALFDND